MKPRDDPNQPIEWLCACVTIPTHLFDATNQAEPLQSLVWMIPNGPVIGSLTLEPGQAPRDVVTQHFREITQSPLVGNPHHPTRIRIATEELAEALDEALRPAIEIVCAPTPEFDALLEGMTEFMQQRQPATPSYLSTGVTDELMAAFFRAAATLYTERPWTCLPADVPILVDVEALSLAGAALIVIGHGNQEFGFLLFASAADFKGFLRDARAARPSASTPMPLFALDYSRGAEIPVELRKQVTTHGWRVADANAYPSLTVPDTRFTERSPTPTQLLQAETISLALAAFASTRRAATAENQPAPSTAVSNVETHAGSFEITLTLSDTPSPVSERRTPDERPARPHTIRAKKKRKY